MPGNGMHEMGLAKPDTAIEEQRVERDALTLGCTPRHSKGKLVRLANDKIGEGVARVESTAQIIRHTAIARH